MAIVTVINNDILISVEKATYENVECIKVNFQKSNSKYKNLEVFEGNNMEQVFVDTKKFIYVMRLHTHYHAKPRVVE